MPKDKIPEGLSLILSGHIHTFSSYDFGGKRPAQLVAGTGGADLTKYSPPMPKSAEVDGIDATIFNVVDHGYLVLDRTKDGWTGTAHKASDDSILAKCDIKGRSLTCH